MELYNGGDFWLGTRENGFPFGGSKNCRAIEFRFCFVVKPESESKADEYLNLQFLNSDKPEPDNAKQL
jgi:hypothetical protein